MVKNAFARLYPVFLVFLLPAAALVAQEQAPQAAEETAREQAGDPAQNAAQDPAQDAGPRDQQAATGVPVFGEDTSGIVHVEGEDAVSTNFASSATLDYGASEYRTLQLNRYTGLQGGAPFYSTYTFYVPEAGSYEFWYAGTPPGPEEDIYPSYTSPFSYILDGADPQPVHWGDVTVVERYSPTHYWIKVGSLELSEGTHTLRVQVTEKRRYDGKFLFFLDSFFLLQDGNPGALDAFRRQAVLPKVFPGDLDAAGFTEPFRSISTYEGRINANPNETQHYFELAYIHALLGQYLEAIKYLKRVQLMNPDDPRPQLLMAKNRIWRQDFDRGLELYRQVLKENPDNLDVWAEAGKVAAWTGKYQESIDFYRDGLAAFPENLNLTVNIGLTHLWASHPEQARERFREAEELAGQDLPRLQELAAVYRVNGYPDRASEVYETIVESFPRRVDAYLALSALYRETDRQEKATEILQRVERQFQSSERLARLLKIARLKQTLRERVIQDYQDRLLEEPDNLRLREELVQTYFWNGLKQRAIEEYENILANQAYRYFQEMDRQSTELLALMSRYHLIRGFLENAEARAEDHVGSLRAAAEEAKNAEQALEEYREEVAEAEDAGEPRPEPGDPPPAMRLELARQELENRFAQLQTYAEQIDATLSRFAELESTFTAILQEEQERQAAFRDIATARGWTWNRKVFLGELRRVAERDVSLARAALARIALAERRFDAAGEYLDQLGSAQSPLPPAPELLLEHRIWTNRPGEALSIIREHGDMLEAYLGYADSLFPLIEAALPPASDGAGGQGAASGSRPAEESIGRAVERLSAAVERAEERMSEVETHLLALHEALGNRLRRTVFRLQDDTRLTRYQLGSYYLDVGNREQAVNQFEQVLSVDPQNLDARYSLATVYEQQGQWVKAMDAYREVYRIDPGFRQTAERHNELARSHADRIIARASLQAETSSLVSHGSMEYRTQLASGLGMKLRYRNDTKRLFKAFGDTVRSHYQLHTFSVSTPVELAGGQWTLEPSVGGAAFSSAFGENEELRGTLASLEDTTRVSEMLATFRAEPVAGVSFFGNIGPYYLSSRYGYERVSETYLAGRPAAYRHTGELTGSGTWRFGDIPWLDSISVRLTESLDFVRSETPRLRNLVSSTAQEGTLYLHAADNPWTTVWVSESLSFQHSQSPGLDEYFAPDAVFLGRGSVGASTWLGSQETTVVGLHARASAGSYVERLPDRAEREPLLYTEGELRVELSRNRATYSAGLTATRSGRGLEQTEYWSMVGRLEMQAQLPDLLAK